MQTYTIIRTIICTGFVSVAYKPEGTPAGAPPYYLSAEPEDIDRFILSIGQSTTIQALLRDKKEEARQVLAQYVGSVLFQAELRTEEDRVVAASRQIGSAFMPTMLPRAQSHAQFLRDPSNTVGAL